MAEHLQPPHRQRLIDLRQLPTPFQYVIALVAVAIVVGLAWTVGKGQPVPEWITTILIPALGWGYVVLVVVATGRWFVRHARSRR